MDVVCCHESHGHPMVVAHFVETNGFETVGLLEAKAVGARGMECDAETFAGKSDGGIQIGDSLEIERDRLRLLERCAVGPLTLTDRFADRPLR